MARWLIGIWAVWMMACGADIRALDAEPAGSTAPIPLDDDVWTWVPFEDAFCANGTVTGIGVNRRAQASSLLIYLQGGGACWDGAGCHGPLPAAVGIQHGYGLDAFRQESNLLGIPWLRRDLDDNAFRDASHVFVPYCTGDLHAGQQVTTHAWFGQDIATHHVGALNMDAFLRRLASTFPDVERIFLAGASAGGFGAMLSLPSVQAAFPHARVDVVDDSGPPIALRADKVEALQAAWNPRWPPGCSSCATNPADVLDHLAGAFPQTRFALLAYAQDAVLSHYSGFSPQRVGARLEELAASFASTPRRRIFLVDGGSHVVISDAFLAVDGVRWTSWLQQLVEGDPAWGNVGP